MTSFTPVGPHDQTLLERVRPTDWPTPTPPDRYDLVVLGGGTGGLVSAAIGVALGARVALVERSLLGGDCLNLGCVPSKGVLSAASAWAGAREAASRFHGPRAEGEGDFAAVMERMRRLRAEIAKVDSAERFRDLGVDIYFGSGTFVARDALEVDGVRLPFRRCILATGARPVMPPIPGLLESDPLTNETIFDLEELPEELVVLGAGAIGSELSLAFARFGSRVTVVDQADRPLFREEPDASAAALAALEG
ncbi:MAG: FAD-dependent oxidoreductase, partial [Longimicrobiales bacterium]|nr:FAD-dependent oxidoreductase [Longimicrobiales bacterium]